MPTLAKYFNISSTSSTNQLSSASVSSECVQHQSQDSSTPTIQLPNTKASKVELLCVSDENDEVDSDDGPRVKRRKIQNLEGEGSDHCNEISFADFVSQVCNKDCSASNAEDKRIRIGAADTKSGDEISFADFVSQVCKKDCSASNTEDKCIRIGAADTNSEEINFSEFLSKINETKPTKSPVKLRQRKPRKSSDDDIQIVKIVESPNKTNSPLRVDSPKRVGTPQKAFVKSREDYSNLKRTKECTVSEREIFPLLSHVGAYCCSDYSESTQLPDAYHWLQRSHTKAELHPSHPFYYRIEKSTSTTPISSRKYFHRPKPCKKATLTKWLNYIASMAPRFRHNDAHKILTKLRSKSDPKSEPWTEVYKPTSVEEFVLTGNSSAMLGLQTWLSSWSDRIAANISGARRKPRKYKGKQDSDSEDDWTEEEDDSSPVLLLSGPHGIGKSACVHMIAEQLGFIVLEVNSSMLRTSRTVYDQFHESTQSQRVVNTQAPAPTLSSFFNRPKRSSQSKPVEHAQPQTQISLSKLSLILFDEVDLVFEADKGFYEAIQKLATEARKPVIMTANDESIIHQLPKLDMVHLRLAPPSQKDLQAYLTTISLVEGNRPDVDRIEQIVQDNQCNIQQSLHQLQFEQLAAREKVEQQEKVVNTTDQSESWSLKDALRKSNYQVLEDILKGSSNQDTPHRKMSMLPAVDEVESEDLCCYEPVPVSDTVSRLAQLSFDYAPTSEQNRKQRRVTDLLPQLEGSQLENSTPWNMSNLTYKDLALDFIPFLKSLCYTEVVRKSLARLKRRFTHHLDRVGVYLSDDTKDWLASQQNTMLVLSSQDADNQVSQSESN